MVSSSKAPRSKTATTKKRTAPRRTAQERRGYHEDVTSWLKTEASAKGLAWTQIRLVGEFLVDGYVTGQNHADRLMLALPWSTLDWFDVAVIPEAAYFLAAAVGVPIATVTNLQSHVATSMPERTERLRVTYAHGTLGDDLEFNARAALWLLWRDGNGYAIRRVRADGSQYRVLEYAPQGDFQDLPGLVTDGEVRGTSSPTR